MANTIQHKRSTTASSVPSAGQLNVGELALNLTDKKIYSKDGSGNVVEMSPTVVADGSITTAKIADSNVTVAKLSATGTPSSSTYLRGDGSWQAVSSTPTTAQVLSATAGASYGAVGTYGFFVNWTTTLNPGDTIAGSSLRPACIAPDVYRNSSAPSGTWRTMGYKDGEALTVFLRIS